MFRPKASGVRRRLDQKIRKRLFHRAPKRGNVESQMIRRECEHVSPTRMEQPVSAAAIAITSMVDRDCRLNQSLVESAFRSRSVMPQIFPNFVRLEELAAIEQVDAGHIARIVFRRGTHASILGMEDSMLGTRTFDGLAVWCRAIRHGHGAGLTLVRMFGMQAKTGPIALRAAAGRIAERLEGGQSLDDALTAEAPNLPELFVALAAVGERSGRIPEVFGQLEEYYSLQGQMRRQFVAQAAWPVFQFVAAVVVIALAIFILGVLAPAGQEPTAPIGFGLTGTSGAILFVAVIGTVVGGTLLAIKVFTSTVAKQAAFEAWLLRVPIVGPCVRAAALSRFCLSLRLTLDSSMSIGKALRLSLKTTGNAAFEAQADRIVKRVRKGEELAKSIGMNPIFPTEFIAALNVGEVSGQIPEVMAKQGEYYREETIRRSKTLTQAMAWGVYGMVAIFIIIAIFRMAGVYVQAIGGGG
jgi:type IV pilus assembly protein PilC